MVDHYAEAERLVHVDDKRSQMAALIHAVLAVAQRLDSGETGCACDETSFSWPAVTDIQPRGEFL